MNDPHSESEAVDASISASPATQLWSVAVVCREPEGISRCVAGLALANHRDIRLFVVADTVVPNGCSHLPITVLNEQLSPQAVERFVVAEMVMRKPGADGFLLLTSNAEIRGIDRWTCRVNKHSATPEAPMVFVDSRAASNLHVLSCEAARRFLADLDGLARALQRPESKQEAFGATFIDWATRTDVTVVENPLLGSSVPATDKQPAQAGSENWPATVSTMNDSIRISGASVSIVVPSWNCADYLSACLQSLLKQTVATEVIVVDDASTDGTNKVLESFGDRITVVRHASQRGANAARNTGIAAASGEFIAFADADNEYAGRWVEKLLGAILADPAAAMAYCGYTKQLADGSRIENRSAPWNLDDLWFGNYIDMSSVVRRSTIPAEGLHEGFRPFDDWRLWLNLAQRGWHGVWVPEELFVKHVRDASKTEQSMAKPHERCRDIAQVRQEFAGLVGLEKPVSVVIPASGCGDLTVQCLKHLGDYCGVPFHVVYVDNGSSLATLDTVAQAASDAGFLLRMIRNQENLGFTHAVNQGIEASGDADVLVLNNDCFVGPGCVENLVRELRFDDRIAAVGPLTGDDGKQSLRRDDRRSLLGLPDDILDQLDDPVRVAIRLSQKLRSVPEPVLSFFCALLRREALTQHGGLDPQFSSGLAADDEWCFRVRSHGHEVRVVLNAYATHLHRTSFERLQLNRDALQQDAQELLHQVLATGQPGKIDQ